MTQEIKDIALTMKPGEVLSNEAGLFIRNNTSMYWLIRGNNTERKLNKFILN